MINQKRTKNYSSGWESIKNDIFYFADLYIKWQA